MTLIVCPALHLAAICLEREPSHVLTVASPRPEERAEALPPGVSHLALTFHDISEPQLKPAVSKRAREPRSLIPPDRTAIDAILAFGRSWVGARPMLVTCALGVSRSTAAAFILACQRQPGAPEHAIAAALRRASPIATPNPLMVALADAALGRQGRMSAAIAAIGRGADYAPYTAFELPTLALA